MEYATLTKVAPDTEATEAEFALMASLFKVGTAEVMMRFEVPSVVAQVAVALVTTELASVTVTVTVLLPPGVLNVTVLPLNVPLTSEAGADGGAGGVTGEAGGVLGAGAGADTLLSSPSSVSVSW